MSLEEAIVMYNRELSISALIICKCDEVQSLGFDVLLIRDITDLNDIHFIVIITVDQEQC